MSTEASGPNGDAVASLRTTRIAIAAISLAAVSTLVLGVRILASGYGADNDTWLMLGTWDAITTQGRYVPSRFQGYPLAEIVIGAAADLGGHWLSGAVSVVLGVASALLLYDLLRRRCPGWADRALLTSVLVVSPPFVVAATTSIDYLYGLTFFLAGWVAFERGASRSLCGLLFGLAVAARISYLPLALVFLIVRPRRGEGESNEKVGSVLVLLVVSALAYLPTAIYSGMSASVLDAERPTGQGLYGLFGRAVVKAGDVLGPVGTLVAIVLMVLLLRVIRRRNVRVFSELWLPIALAVQLVLWIWLPVEPSYLLPALAMVLVVVAPHVGGRAVQGLLVALVVATVSSGWISPQFVDYQYDNVYGEGSCDPTEAVGASLRLGLQPGVLLEYPNDVRRLAVCNEAQRSAQLERLPPVRP